MRSRPPCGSRLPRCTLHRTTPPQAGSCPAKSPAGAQCYNGRDSEGTPYWIAIPEHWAVMVKAGYAWAGSAYRRGGYGVTMAAEDVERLRHLFVHWFGRSRRIILHGQSYGGGSNAYQFRLDLHVVYQYVCANHPRRDAPPYPLWMGLSADSKMTSADLAAPVKECTGIGMLCLVIMSAAVSRIGRPYGTTPTGMSALEQSTQSSDRQVWVGYCQPTRHGERQVPPPVPTFSQVDVKLPSGPLKLSA